MFSFPAQGANWSTLGLSLTCPVSPEPAGMGCRDRGHGASVPKECPAEHVPRQPWVRNEERPLFTIKRNQKKIYKIP